MATMCLIDSDQSVVIVINIFVRVLLTACDLADVKVCRGSKQDKSTQPLESVPVWGVIHMFPGRFPQGILVVTSMFHLSKINWAHLHEQQPVQFWKCGCQFFAETHQSLSEKEPPILQFREVGAVRLHIFVRPRLVNQSSLTVLVHYLNHLGRSGPDQAGHCHASWCGVQWERKRYCSPPPDAP